MIRRARIAVTVVLLVAVVAVASSFSVIAGCHQTTGFGGPSCWWDQAPWVIRGGIRTTWSILTGQPITRDLFPF